MVHAGARPNVTEIGPIRYVYKQKKYNISWEEENNGDVVTFSQWQYYVPYTKADELLANTTVTSINMPLMGVLNNPLGVIALIFINYEADPLRMFINRTVNDIIFGWVNDTLLSVRACMHACVHEAIITLLSTFASGASV